MNSGNIQACTKGSTDGEAGLKSALKWSQKEALGQLTKHSSMQAQKKIQYKCYTRGPVALKKINNPHPLMFPMRKTSCQKWHREHLGKYRGLMLQRGKHSRNRFILQGCLTVYVLIH